MRIDSNCCNDPYRPTLWQPHRFQTSYLLSSPIFPLTFQERGEEGGGIRRNVLTTYSDAKLRYVPPMSSSSSSSLT